MASQNKVTLTFAGDATALSKTFRDVQAGASQTELAMKGAATGSAVLAESSKMTSVQAMSAAKGVRELAASTLLLSRDLPPAAQQAALLTMSLGDLSGAATRIIPALKNFASTLTLGKVALGGTIAAIAAAGAALSAHIDHTSAVNEVERTFADTAYYAADAVSTVTAKIPFLGHATDALKDKLDGVSRAAHGMADALESAADIQAKLAANGLGVGAAVDGWDTAAILAPGTTAWNRLQASADAISAAQAKKASRSSGGGGGSAISAAQQAANDALSKWQSTIDKAVQVGRSIAEALAPKLVAGSKSGLILNPGTSMIEQLKQQLTQTIRLKHDLAALAKAGLNSDLLTQLTNGGLGSLPLTSELLAGGKGGIAEVNKLAGKITGNANSIAQSETAREFSKPQKPVTVKFDVTGTDAEWKKIFRKALRADKSFANDIKAAVA